MAGWMGQLLGIAAAGTWLALLAVLALLLRQRWPQRGEWSRKVVHIGAGPVVLIAWAMAIDRPLAIGAAALVTLLAALNHRHRLLPGIEEINRSSYGTVAYGASITLLLLAFWPAQPLSVAAGVLVMALGDGLAGLVGPALASPSWRILGERRSLAGTATMAITSLAVLLGLRALGSALGLPTPPASLAAALALLATMLEQLAIGGLDNLSVPLLVGWLWSSLARL